MLNLTELEKVVAVLKAKENFLSPQVSALLEFAKLALSLKEMPRDVDPEPAIPGISGSVQKCINYGKNEQNSLWRAWLTARLTTLEDAFDNCSCASVTHLGDCALKAKIREHFTGEGR